MVNYACAFRQSELGKYFEWIIITINEWGWLMKNYGDQGGCYPSRPKAEADNTLRDLHNSSHETKAEFNNCFIIYLK